MENNGGTDSIVSHGANKIQIVDTFLNEHAVNKKDALSYEKFRAICLALFDSKEIEENEWRIQQIFDLFHCKSDDLLYDQKWNAFYEWLRITMEPINVLIVVDVQNDFIDGSLALRGCGCGQDGADVIDPINHLIAEGNWHKIVYSLDWHPENHISFYENLHMRELHPDSKISKQDAKPFDTVLFSEPFVEQKLWPKHCIMNTWGAELHKDLIIAPSSEQLRKGQDPQVEAYSVFFEKNSEDSIILQDILSKIHATHLYICGLAYDVCVRHTCLDALRFGYALAVIDDCCRGTDINNIESAKNLISKNGGLVTHSSHVLSLVNKTRRSLVMAHQTAKSVFSRTLPGNVLSDPATENSL